MWRENVGREEESVLCEGTECVCAERETGERGMASRVVFALRVCVVVSSGMVSGVCLAVFCVQASNIAGKRSRPVLA